MVHPLAKAISDVVENTAAKNREIKRLTKNVEDVYVLLNESREIRRRLAIEIERLRKNWLQQLHQFLEEKYPKMSDRGWMQRDTQRRNILDFLVEFAEAAKGGES